MKTAVIIGAGPAGLTAARELLRVTDVRPLVLEATGDVGGLSKTVAYHGNRIDIGGHRFFSKSDTVTQFWLSVMPLQMHASRDELLTGSTETGQRDDLPDPENEDRVMLRRRRVSRIYYRRRFFDYPVSLSWRTLASMGFFTTVKVGLGYLAARLHKLPETSLENFYVNRFGRPLYEMFFEDYTEKVWGVSPSELGADWGSQRVKGLSVTSLLADMIRKKLGQKTDVPTKDTETSLIERFLYPKLGPGQLWGFVASEVMQQGGEVRLNSPVEQINVEGNRVVSVVAGGKVVPCDYLLSSMPIKDLVAALRGVEVPADVRRVACELPYRDFITVGLLVDKLKIKNKTKFMTYADRVPDTWIYIQEPDVRVGRLQVFNNWSPYMVEDYENTIWIGLEYFCNEGDEMWTASDQDFIAMAIDELVKIDILESRDDVTDSVRIRTPKAYPAYYGSYSQLQVVRDFLDGITNLFCIGRNGQHRYNNMDHSMLTAMEAVANIKKGISTKENIWNVNTEKDYHESK